jgi:diguanylate cyclase (GGDEF)-like protein
VDFLGIHIPASCALAAVAAIGYLAGRCRGANRVAAQSNRELRHARAVARELEGVVRTLRRNLAQHRASLNVLQERAAKLGAERQEAPGTGPRREVEQSLVPTLQLATQLADVCDLIREQADHLASVAQVQADPLTGLSNRRALDNVLAVRFAMLERYEAAFSVVLFEMDHFDEFNEQERHAQSDRLLRQVAALLRETARQTDVVGRYGDEQFLLVMPQTGLEGASAFSERFRAKVEERLPVTVSGGVATVVDGDDPNSLLARAGAALDAAKSSGRNCVFRHDGGQSESIWEEVAASES